MAIMAIMEPMAKTELTEKMGLLELPVGTVLTVHPELMQLLERMA